jgi:hypothetical protein
MADVGLEEIEANALAYLKAKWPAGSAKITEFDISADPKNIASPGVYVSAECTGFSRVAHNSYKKSVMIHVYLIFAHLQGPMHRRKGAHPLVLAIEQLLIGKTLSLAIQPLVPVRSVEITDAELRTALKLGFRIDLSTFFGITAMTEEQAADLLKITASYMFKPGDNVADFTDAIDLH